MATTSEQLAQAVSAINTLNQTYTQEVGKWQGERNTLTTLLAQAIASAPSMRKQFFIDSINGNDTNEGTSSKPFATIEKALNLASQIFAGSVEIYCRPGVYDVTTYRTYMGIRLFIGGTAINNTNDVVINWRAPAHDLYNGLFSCRFCTLVRVAIESAAHIKAVIKLTQAGAMFGAYIAGTISATNRSFHFISDGCGLFAAESAGGFVSMEFSYAENTNATSVSIAQSRGMLLLYKTSNTILSNFGTAVTEIKHARFVE
jgi:hypothetical protein